MNEITKQIQEFLSEEKEPKTATGKQLLMALKQKHLVMTQTRAKLRELTEAQKQTATKLNEIAGAMDALAEQLLFFESHQDDEGDH